LPFGGSKDVRQTSSKATIAHSGWQLVIDTESPSQTGTNETTAFINACLTAKKHSFGQSPFSIKHGDGFKYQTKGGEFKIALDGKSDIEFAATLGDAVSQHGALHAADPHCIGNALATIMLTKAGYSTEHICPSMPRTPACGEVGFGDFVLMKKEAEGVVEDVGVVFEIKSTRFRGNSFVIDSHGLALVDSKYDVLLVFTLLPSREGPYQDCKHGAQEYGVASSRRGHDYACDSFLRAEGQGNGAIGGSTSAVSTGLRVGSQRSRQKLGGGIAQAPMHPVRAVCVQPAANAARWLPWA
jgi:hypothetical protein